MPRLWPFLYHNSSSVRNSALKTLETLTSSSANPAIGSSLTVFSTSVQNEGSAEEARLKTCSKQREVDDIGIKKEAKLDLSDTLDVKHTCTTDKIECKLEIKLSTDSIDSKVNSVKKQTDFNEVEKENIILLEVEKEVDESALSQGECAKEKEDVTQKSSNIEKIEKELDSSVVEDKCPEGAEAIVSKKCNLLSTNASCQAENTPADVTQSVESGGAGPTAVESPCNWIQPIIQPALTHIYQRALLEHNKDNLELIFQVRIIFFITAEVSTVPSSIL